jgi:hypothetical protein
MKEKERKLGWERERERERCYRYVESMNAYSKLFPSQDEVE